MIISTGKTKCMVISKKTRKCKLEITGQIIKQVMTFNYPGIEITSERKLYIEKTRQATKLKS